MLFIIYILALTNSKYYIGKSTDIITDNFDEHIFTSNLEWTSRYKPIRIIEQFESSDLLEEDLITKKYMFDYGIENVRGGSYTELILDNFQIEELENEFKSTRNKYYRCRKNAHNSKYCIEYKDEIYLYLNNFTTIEEIDDELCRLEKQKNNIDLINSFLNGPPNQLYEYNLVNAYSIKYLELIIKFEKLDKIDQDRLMNERYGEIHNRDDLELILKSKNKDFAKILILLSQIFGNGNYGYLNYYNIYKRYYELFNEESMKEYKKIPYFNTDKLSIKFLSCLNKIKQVSMILDKILLEEISVEEINKKIYDLLVKRLDIIT